MDKDKRIAELEAWCAELEEELALAGPPTRLGPKSWAWPYYHANGVVEMLPTEEWKERRQAVAQCLSRLFWSTRETVKGDSYPTQVVGNQNADFPGKC